MDYATTEKLNTKEIFVLFRFAEGVPETKQRLVGSWVMELSEFLLYILC